MLLSKMKGNESDTDFVPDPLYSISPGCLGLSEYVDSDLARNLVLGLTTDLIKA